LPFLRLTRDRRGFENTFLLHADRPGDRPRLLYWYRTAPGIMLGRSPLDEDAIRTIEEQHPEIEFDWPAILALSEVMTPEEEAPARPQPQQRQGRRQRDRDERRDQRPASREQEAAPSEEPASELDAVEPGESAFAREDAGELRRDEPDDEPPLRTMHGLLEELVGREIATRLRARYSEIMARIHEKNAESALGEAWLKRAEPLNPDLWLTADAVLEGVRRADSLFERLRAELLHSSRE